MDQHEYQRQWYQKNKVRLRQKHKDYYEANKDTILAHSKQYREATKDARNHRGRKYYAETKEQYAQRVKIRRDKQKELVDAVAVHYGCQNPKCQWTGEYKACHLDFHHLDPKTKTKAVSQLLTASKRKIAAEDNKCVVLCRNCHCEFHDGGFVLNEPKTCRVDENINVIFLSDAVSFSSPSS